MAQVAARIAIIGDVHEQWDEADNAYFNQSEYDLLLFVGDLTSILSFKRTPSIARRLSRLRKPALMIAGNHDIHNLMQMLAEAMDHERLMYWSGARHAAFHERLQAWIAPVALGGYSAHSYAFGGVAFDVIAARPCSMGSGVSVNGVGSSSIGKRLNFARMLRDVYGVETMAQSAERLKQCVDRAQSERLIFLAHNGPAGLGSAPDDLWGRDFGAETGGDWGDEDLRIAIDYAVRRGKRVELVAAGHMHLRTKQGKERPWLRRVDGTNYVNVARVPRVRAAGRHHVRVEVLEEGVRVEEWFV